MTPTPAARMGEDREALIEALRTISDHAYNRREPLLLSEAANAILAAGFTRSAPGWIACEDSLPAEGVEVLVTEWFPYMGDKSGDCATAWHHGHTRSWIFVFDDNGEKPFKPTHWMPLPTPPARPEGEGAQP